MLAAPLARADYLWLKDENIVEVKVLAQVMKPGPGNKDVPHLECEDERGEKRYFNVKDIKERFAAKTSWEVRAENEKWYEVNAPKVKDTWQAHVSFAISCRGDKKLHTEALVHFQKAYDLRAALPLDTGETQEARHRKLAEWLEKDCGMLDEAVNENAKVYEQIKATPKEAVEHQRLAKWCVEHDLDAQAEEQYKAAIAKAPDDKIIAKAFDAYKRAQAVPMNHGMYNLLQKNLEMACKYIKSQQAADGTIGADAEEAGVQALRGMTAISAEALMAEWDIRFYLDPEAAGKPPKEVTKALDFILSGKKGSGRFMGDDLWGPSLTLQFLIRASSRPYLQDRKPEIDKGIQAAIEELKKLQRDDAKVLGAPVKGGGWNYYNFIPYSASFLTASILVNLCAAKNLGYDVDSGMIEKAKDFVASVKFGKGTYQYSPSTGRSEGGTNTSFSPVGASARSPLCELGRLAAGDGDKDSLKQAITNFYQFQPILAKLRGKAVTHVGKGRTAPYYYMFGHYWTSRCIHQLPRNFWTSQQNFMYGCIAGSQAPDGTFHDFTGTKAYKVYATALGVLTMHELICAEPDPAFTPGGAKLLNIAPPAKKEEKSASEDAPKKTDAPKK